LYLPDIGAYVVSEDIRDKLPKIIPSKIIFDISVNNDLFFM